MMFPTRFTARPARGETDFSPSLTVPDQSMSILQILQRFAQGVDPGLTKVPIYDGEDYDDPILDPDFDLADVDPAELREQVKTYQQQLNDLERADENATTTNKTTMTQNEST